jgi:hypothetical protein
LETTSTFKHATSDMKTSLPEYFKPKPKVSHISSTHTPGPAQKRVATQKQQVEEQSKLLQAAWSKGQNAPTQIQADIGKKQRERMKKDVIHAIFKSGVGDALRTANTIR